MCDIKGHDGWFYHMWLIATVDPLLSSWKENNPLPFVGSIIIELGFVKRERDREKKEFAIRVCKDQGKVLDLHQHTFTIPLMASGMYLYVYAFEIFLEMYGF